MDTIFILVAYLMVIGMLGAFTIVILCIISKSFRQAFIEDLKKG